MWASWPTMLILFKRITGVLLEDIKDISFIFLHKLIWSGESDIKSNGFGKKDRASESEENSAGEIPIKPLKLFYIMIVY